MFVDNRIIECSEMNVTCSPVTEYVLLTFVYSDSHLSRKISVLQHQLTKIFPVYRTKMKIRTKAENKFATSDNPFRTDKKYTHTHTHTHTHTIYLYTLPSSIFK